VVLALNFNAAALEPSAELKTRYKEDCPNNYKALIAAFGRMNRRLRS